MLTVFSSIATDTKSTIFGRPLNNSNMEVSKSPIGSFIHVPMKFFATLDSDRTPRNCIPRLCSFTITGLIIRNKILPAIKYVFIAVKISGSKKTLRSDEIHLSSEGTVNTRLQLSISLQYLHNLKGKNNKLTISLHVRNRYKSRRMPGYKCLAKGFIDMNHILQMPRDETLSLTRTPKKIKQIVYTVAEVELINISSQPIYYPDENHSAVHIDIFSDEEEADSGNDIFSESEPTINCIGISGKTPQYRRHGIKNKLLSLIGRFRKSEVALRRRKGHKCHCMMAKKISIDFSGDKIDKESTLESDDSVTSIPKPRLTPFFQERDQCTKKDLSKSCVIKENTTRESY